MRSKNTLDEIVRIHIQSAFMKCNVVAFFTALMVLGGHATTFAAEPGTLNGDFLKDLETRLLELHDSQLKRVAIGEISKADMYLTNVLLNRALYLAGKKTKQDFVSLSEKLYTAALATLDARVKSGNPPSDAEFENLFKIVLEDRMLP